MSSGAIHGRWTRGRLIGLPARSALRILHTSTGAGTACVDDAARASTMERSDRWLAVALRLGLLSLFIWMVRGQLIPVTLGALFASIAEPIERRIGRLLRSRARWAPALTTLGALLVVLLPATLLAARAASSIEAFLSHDWTPTFGRVREFLATRSGIRGRLGIGADQLAAAVDHVVRAVASGAASFAGAVAAGLPSTILAMFLFVLSLYYFLRDGKAFVARIVKLSPFSAEDTQKLLASIHETVKGAILGTVVTAAVQGALATVVFFILRVPGAVLLGVLTSLFAFVPVIGTTPVMVGVIIYLLAVGRTASAIVMLAAALGIGFSDNIVRPMVQKSRSKAVHPLLILLGIFGGLAAFGAAGVLLGPVVAAVAVWSVQAYADLHPG
jgi:predicted PurR-regulated permease PerM